MRPTTLFILILFLTTSCTSSDKYFFESAYGKPPSEIKILSYQTEISDNLFRSEHSWLLKVSDKNNWVNKVSLLELGSSNKSDNGFYITQHLLTKFPDAFSFASIKRLYFIKEIDGKSHYLLRTEQGNTAIYYISTL